MTNRKAVINSLRFICRKAKFEVKIQKINLLPQRYTKVITKVLKAFIMDANKKRG
jgi:hypothetical protein